MASPFSGWIMDPARNQYYFFSTEEQAYIYQTGERIYLQAQQVSPPEPEPTSAPEPEPTHVSKLVLQTEGINLIRQSRQDTSLYKTYERISTWLGSPMADLESRPRRQRQVERNESDVSSSSQALHSLYRARQNMSRSKFSLLISFLDYSAAAFQTKSHTTACVDHSKRCTVERLTDMSFRRKSFRS